MFSLKFKTDNAAFGDYPAAEVARILRDIANAVENEQTVGRCRDVNGNSVGEWKLTGSGR